MADDNVVYVRVSDKLYKKIEELAEERKVSKSRAAAEALRDYFDWRDFERLDAQLNITNTIREVIHHEITPQLVDIKALMQMLLDVLKSSGINVSEKELSKRIVKEMEESDSPVVVGKEMVGLKEEPKEEMVEEEELEPPEPEMGETGSEEDKEHEESDDREPPEIPESEIVNLHGFFDHLREKTKEIGGNINPEVMNEIRESHKEEEMKEKEKRIEEKLKKEEEKLQKGGVERKQTQNKQPPQQPKSQKPETPPPQGGRSNATPREEQEEGPLIIYDAEYPIVKGLKVVHVHPRFVMYEDGSIWDRNYTRWHKTGPKLAKIRLEAGEPI